MYNAGGRLLHLPPAFHKCFPNPKLGDIEMRSQRLIYVLASMALLLAAFFYAVQPSAYAAPPLSLTQTAEALQPTNTPTPVPPTDTPTPLPTDTPTPVPTNTPTPLPTNTPTPVPTNTPTSVIIAPANTATPLPSVTPTVTPTATPLPPETLPETGATQPEATVWLPLAFLAGAILLSWYILRRRAWTRE